MIDPKSGCRIDITVNSYFTTRDARNEYNRDRLGKFTVDSEEYSIIDLEKDIASEFKWGSDQQANFWVLTEGSMTCKLVSDAQFLDLLRASRVVKLLMVVGRHEHNVREGEIPASMNNKLEVVDIGFAWVELLQYGETTGGPPMADEEEKDHFITVGYDPNGDEPAGVDEEWRYFKDVDPVENLTDQVQKRKRAMPVPEIRDYYA